MSVCGTISKLGRCPIPDIVRVNDFVVWVGRWGRTRKMLPPAAPARRANARTKVIKAEKATSIERAQNPA